MNPATNIFSIRSIFRNIPLIVLIAVFFFGIPLAILAFQSKMTGKTFSQIIHKWLFMDNVQRLSSNLEIGEYIDFLSPLPIGNEFSDPPQISNLEVVDLDQDGLLDIVLCDVLNNNISWIRQSPKDTFHEYLCADNLLAPSHIQAFDIDQDGDLDLIVSLLGMLFPSNDKIGSIVILENDGMMNFRKHLIVERIARVSDVRAGDLDNDGDIDLVAVQFGYDDGETRWLENKGDWQFKSHILQTLSGGVNCELVDIDDDADLDIVTIISQEWEEIYLFLNDGKGQFLARLIYGVSNDDFGSSGIYLYDMDSDADLDILYTNGDAFDYIPPRPRPWHGVNLLENLGNYEFTFHRLADFGGAYNARPLDVDSDGDLDIFVVSSFNQWNDSQSQSFIWLENVGEFKFIRHNITNTPTHILALELGDFNNDGSIDMVTGGMHIYPPYNRMARVMLWQNDWNTVLTE